MHHQLVIRMSALILTVFTAAAGTGLAWQSNSALRAMDAVMGYRRGFMGDTLRFDACTVFNAAGRPADFPAGISPGNLVALDRSGGRPCDEPEPTARLPYRVYVDSVSLSDSIGHVYLTVARGEATYRETFTLPRLHNGWGVREARVWGALRIVAPPPGSGTR